MQRRDINSNRTSPTPNVIPTVTVSLADTDEGWRPNHSLPLARSATQEPVDEEQLLSPTSRPDSLSSRPDSVSSSAPLLPHDGERDVNLPTQPPPLFNPPSYRITTAPPPYSSWRSDKYSPINDDIEAGATDPNSVGIRWNGWRIWGIIVVLIALTITVIVIALTRTGGTNASDSRTDGSFQ